MPYTHVDCFSGPGGFCTGLHAAGFETKVAIEYIKSCVDTYSANHPEVHVIHSDIREVTADQILPYIPKEGIDLVTSGMPCETFSTAGNSSRAAYDDRQFLFREGIRIAQIVNAKMILFENVPNIQNKRIAKDSKELVIDYLKKELEEAGYGNFKEFVLDASKYGVPQKRKRFFILASKDSQIDVSQTPVETTPDKEVTVKDAFIDIPEDIKGIRIRQGNILIGDENTLRKCYKEERFNSWMVGELLVFNEDIIPNTRRDDYEKNSAYKELLSQFTEWANEMSRQIRHRSYERSLTQSDKKFLSDESVTDVDGVDISLGTELDSYDMDDSDSVANTDLLSKLSLLMDMGKKKTKYNVLNLNSKFTVDQKQTLEHVFDALYAKYTNAKANDIIQTIIDSF